MGARISIVLKIQWYDRSAGGIMLFFRRKKWYPKLKDYITKNAHFMKNTRGGPHFPLESVTYIHHPSESSACIAFFIVQSATCYLIPRFGIGGFVYGFGVVQMGQESGIVIITTCFITTLTSGWAYTLLCLVISYCIFSLLCFLCIGRPHVCAWYGQELNVQFVLFWVKLWIRIVLAFTLSGVTW